MPVFSNKWTPFLLAVIIGVLIWNHFRAPDSAPPPETPEPQPRVAASAPTIPAGNVGPSATAVPVPPDAPAAAISSEVPPATATNVPSTAKVLPGSVAESPAAPEEDNTEDLSAVDSAIRNYQAVHGENPVGSNAEITSALFINNPKQIKLEVPQGSSINAEGQLCDRWGTPYFFHQLSATEMEIRSAGPDRTMWTGDDSQN